MNKKLIPVIVVGVLGMIGLMFYSSMNLSSHRVEVCVEYQGRQSCKTASGETRENAIRTATTNACAFVASGMTDSMACEHAPSKIREFK
jgi:prephenate dehydrogenase